MHLGYANTSVTALDGSMFRLVMIVGFDGSSGNLRKRIWIKTLDGPRFKTP